MADSVGEDMTNIQQTTSITGNILNNISGQNGSYNTGHKVYNVTVDRPEANTLINAGIITFSSISLTCGLIFLRILTKCQRLPAPIKYLSQNFVITFMFIDFTIWLHSIAMLLWGRTYLYQIIFDSRIFFAGVGNVLLWCSLVALTYERVLTLVKPFVYHRYTSETKVTLCISAMWTINILVPATVFICSALQFCNFSELYSCDVYNLFDPFKKCILVFLTLYGLLILVGYVKIMSIIFKHQRSIKAQLSNKNSSVPLGDKLRATKATAAIVFAFIISQSPLFFHSFIVEIQPNLKQHHGRIIFQGLCYIGYQLLVYISLYLYIWKFKECKMQFYFLFSNCCKKFEQKADHMRIEVFDIVVYEPRRQKTWRRGSDQVRHKLGCAATEDS